MKIYNQYYAYHAAKFGIEFGRVVNDVKVRMTDPGFSSSVIQCLRQLQILTPAVMILNPDTIAIRIRLDGFRKDWLYLQRVEIFSAFRRWDHMNDLIIARVSQFDGIPAVGFHQPFPNLFWYNWQKQNKTFNSYFSVISLSHDSPIQQYQMKQSDNKQNYNNEFN